MSREDNDEKVERQLKRMRRARGGRILPRSGQGVHEDKKSKKINELLEEEYDEEMRHWDLEEEIEDNYEDQDEHLAWEEYKMRQKKEEEDGFKMADKEWDRFYLEWLKKEYLDGTSD